MSGSNAGKERLLARIRETFGRMASRWPRPVLALLFFGLLIPPVLQIACTPQGGVSSSAVPATSATPAETSPVFTPAHRSFFGAVKEFFLWQSRPTQPIAFNHKIHIQNGLQCTGCHTGATQGPDAGIPSVTFCMACHQAIATNNPQIKKLAAYAAKGQEPPWKRVFWFYPAAHVQFWHAPHVRAGIACKRCHGDIAQETVAVKTKTLNMRFCLNCHHVRGVSVDCTTCHY